MLKKLFHSDHSSNLGIDGGATWLPLEEADSDGKLLTVDNSIEAFPSAEAIKHNKLHLLMHSIFQHFYNR